MELWDKWKVPLGIVAALIVIGIVWATYANAADKGGDRPSFLPIGEVANKSNPFSGCGVGISGAGVIGQVSADSYPINLGSNGQLASGVLSCDLQAGQFVFGGAVEYGWFLGDLNDIGADTDLTIRGRAGFLLTPNTLLFGHAGWSRIEGGGDNLDGWKFGPGVSVNIPGSRVFVDFRYDYGVWDSPISGIDVNSHAGVVALTYKFGK